MAHVSDVRLSMGRVSSRIEFAEVTARVDFASKEVAENLNFGLFIPLVEVDDAFDTYHYNANGGFNVSIDWRSVGDLDDFVTWIAARTIRPNGSSTRFVRERKEFDVGDQEGGNEEYRALVWVVPEIFEGKSWSNILRVNLG